jgi:hypothetical protein
MCVQEIVQELLECRQQTNERVEDDCSRFGFDITHGCCRFGFDNAGGSWRFGLDNAHVPKVPTHVAKHRGQKAMQESKLCRSNNTPA